MEKNKKKSNRILKSQRMDTCLRRYDIEIATSLENVIAIEKKQSYVFSSN